jgi:hypothetical protein
MQMLKQIVGATLGLTLAAYGSVAAQDGKTREKTEGMTKFTVRIENISTKDGMKAKDGMKWSFAMSPGLCIVHTNNAPVFSVGKKDRGKGLENQAEEGNPAMLAKSLQGDKGVKSVTIFNTPIGTDVPAPITPGFTYECTFEAAPGAKLTITSMFGQSNDLFYAPNESGIALFNNGKPVSGDITAKMILWDAGTEVNQEPGVGANQAPRQKAPNTGETENSVVKNIKDVKDGFSYPKTASVMKVTITPGKAPGSK